MSWLRREKGKRWESFGPSVLRNEELDLPRLGYLLRVPLPRHQMLIQLIQLPSNGHLLRLLTLHLRHHPGLLRTSHLRCFTV